MRIVIGLAASGGGSAKVAREIEQRRDEFDVILVEGGVPYADADKTLSANDLSFKAPAGAEIEIVRVAGGPSSAAWIIASFVLAAALAATIGAILALI